MDEITVVGGGLAGLIAALEAAEAGVPVRVLEARRHLGGRAVSSPPPFVANLGPHALYTGTALWDWLVARGLDRGCRTPSPVSSRVRIGGRIRRVPPPGLLGAMVRLRGADAPGELDLRTWLTSCWGTGERASARIEAVASMAGVLTFDHDPGRLSAAFVWERVRRILLSPKPVARYVDGGWSALVDRLAAAARERGVRIETGAKLDSLADLQGPGGSSDGSAGTGPVIVAVSPGAARRLLDDDGLRATSPRVGLLDVGVRSRRGDPNAVLDADEASFLTRPSATLPGLAPDGHDVVQVSAPLRPDEELDDGVRRAERLLDDTLPGWRDREVWRRRSVVTESTGAIDLPGTTWRDRPRVTHAPGVWLAGDWVASPGHLSETSCTSAVTAAAGALAVLRSRRPRPSLA
ncbi:MAG TPA: FAD-dependent oxidoreductase [Acidimicrobiales bacterium]|nr:FAD-dependent oxidoreductase [Acidimicrobiales bacterium]